MVNTAHYIPLLPLLAFVVNIFLGRKLGKASAWISVAACAFSGVLAWNAWMGLEQGQGSYTVFCWLMLGETPLDFGVMVDPLSCMMLMVVTVIGTLILIYSMGYMHEDERFSRFFAYLSLFLGAMLGLILADNFVMLFLFWEGVGLGSYLLISFWFTKPEAASAGLKAFVTTRIGDTGLLIGILILFFSTHTLYFRDLASLPVDQTILTVAALLIFSGAVGKSAQFPLHVWLPDAMEGPTPVSALIHAATMVAAGVYLVARTYSLFAAHEVVLFWVAAIGAVSALMAATIAMVNNDLKRILAYSTISQLGLMMVGLGVGGYTAGTFHLMTHAFFKALLFLCAGSVIHAIHTQDIRQMGGLLGRMKITSVAFIIGALAIAGVPPLAGFWSKDELLSAALHNGHPVLFGVVLLTSLLTAFYISRLIFLVLFGKSRGSGHGHESPIVMTGPLVVLSLFAIGIGWVGSPFMHHAFQKFIAPGGVHGQAEADVFVMVLSSLVSALGIGGAYVICLRGNRILPAGVRSVFSGLYKLAANKYYIDEIYTAVLVRPCLGLCRWLGSFDSGVIDGAVNGVAHAFVFCGSMWRRMQTGLVQNYLMVQVAGIVLLVLILLKVK